MKLASRDLFGPLVSGNFCIVWTNYRQLDQLPTLWI